MHSLAERTLWTVFANDMSMVTMYTKPDAEDLTKRLNEVADRLRDVESRRPIHWNVQSSRNLGTPHEEPKMSRSEMDCLLQFCFEKVGYNQFQHVLDGDNQNPHSDWGLV